MIKAIEARKRKDGSVGYRVKWYNPEKPGEDSRTFDNEPAAQKFRASLVIADGRLPVEEKAKLAKGITIAEYAPQTIAWSKGSARYKKDNLRDFNAHILPHLGHYSVAEIGFGPILEWQDKLIAAGVSHKSVATYRTSILAPMFKRSQMPGPNGESPIRMFASPLLAAPLPENPDPYVAETINVKEVGIFFAAAYEISAAIADFLLVMLATGWRWSELKALQVNGVDLDEGYITVRRVFGIDEHNQPYLKRRAKSKHSSDRESPVPVAIVAVLKRLCEGKKHNDFVFTNPAGVAWPRTTFNGNWVRIVARAKMMGLPDKKLTPHGMRHSFLSHLGAEDIPNAVLQDLAGHGSWEMTRHYARPGRRARLRVVTATEGLLANVKGR